MHRDRNSALAAAAILLAAAPFARATDYTFTGSSGNWSDPTNWANATVPINDPTSHVIYQGSNTSLSNSTLDAANPLWILNGITFNQSFSSSNPAQLTIDPASILQFAGPNPFIEQDGGTPVTINGPINLTNGLTIKNTRSGDITLNGPITGTGPLVDARTITSTLSINGVNTFSGGITLAPASNGGFANVSIGQPESLGSGNLTLIHPVSSSGFPQLNVFFQAGTSNATTINNNIVLTDQNPTFNGSTWIQFFSAGVSAPHTYNLQHIIATTPVGIGFASQFGANSSLTTWNIQSLSLNGNAQISGNNFNIASISESSPSSLSLSGTFNTVHFTGPGNYSGGTAINFTSLYADAPNSLGTGPLTLQSSSSHLYLNASSAAQNNITGNNGSIAYNANAAAGGHNLSIGTSGTITIAPTVTSLGADSFTVAPAANLVGNTATLALLDRAIGSATTPNFFPAPGARIENIDGGFPSIQNLGNNADLLPIFNGTTSINFSVGAGTPWQGFGTTAAATYEATVTANSNFLLAGGWFRCRLIPFKIVVPAGNAPVTVTINGANFNGPSNFSGVDHFDVTGRLFLNAANDLGGANTTAPAPTNILANATLEVASASAINGSVLLRAGSNLTIDSAGLTGTGTISRDNQPLTVDLNNIAALGGSQFHASFIQPGDTVLLPVNNIVGLKNINPAATYALDNSNASSLSQAEGFNINGGTLTFVSIGTQSLDTGPAAQGDSTIRIGTLGASISSAGNFVNPLTQGGIPTLSTNGAHFINVPIIAQGPVTFGSPNPADNSRGCISITNTANQFSTISINNIALIATSPAAITCAHITLNGGELALLGTSTSSNATNYPNPINLTTDAVLTNFAQGFGVNSTPIQISLSSLTLGNATLFANIQSFNQTPLAISALHLNGNATLTKPAATANWGNPLFQISSIDEDATPRALTIVGSATISGPISSTGPINLNNGLFQIDGPISPATVPLSIGPSVTTNSPPNTTILTGKTTIHRPVIFSNNTSLNSVALSPGDFSNSIISPPFLGDTIAPRSNPGTLTLDSLTLSPDTALLFNFSTSNVIGGPTNDLVIVNGDLTLAGTLYLSLQSSRSATYTLFTYTGTLTNDGLAVFNNSGTLDFSTPGQVNLIIPAPTPEPASLALLAAAAPFLLKRRRR